MMKIIVDSLKLFAHHGVLPQEQLVGSYFYVSVTAETECTVSALSDELSDTVSYADIVECVNTEMSITSKLLEHVCGRIARRLLQDHPTLTRVTVRVIKENPPFGAQCNGAGVEISLP